MLIKYYRVGVFELSIGQRIDKFQRSNPYVVRNQRDNWRVAYSFLPWLRVYELSTRVRRREEYGVQVWRLELTW